MSERRKRVLWIALVVLLGALVLAALREPRATIAYGTVGEERGTAGP